MNDLQKRVLGWLQSTGFPLEMAAADAFRKAGFDTRQSSQYADLEAMKGREIDVVARDPDHLGAINIVFAIECKSSSRPWVVLKSDHALAAFNRVHAFSLWSHKGREVLGQKIDELGTLMPYLMRGSEGGYGLRQALADGGGDAAFTAAVNVIKASFGLIHPENCGSEGTASFAFPVIVIDTPLFECSLSENGELILVEVEESEFLFACHIPNYVTTCIKVVKKEHLLSFATKSKVLAASLRSDLSQYEIEIMAAMS